ncbi:MAG: tetratricopeptide repeat protein [Gemmatimonadetes bacterium]|nr:tetratricopeptide repeat protein [Gemmatimonadota bacterium]
MNERAIGRALLMHGTSWARERAARLVGRLAVESGSRGAAFGPLDPTDLNILIPVCAVSDRAGMRWDSRLRGTVTRLVTRDGGTAWCLMVRGIDPARLGSLSSWVDFVAGRLRRRGGADRPSLPSLDRRGAYASFLASLDAFRLAGFGFSSESRAALGRQELLRSLPGPGSPAALAVAGALSDPDRLTAALVGFGRDLEDDGATLEAAAAYIICYELALLHQGAADGFEAARSAGRAFRRAARWDEALRWYGLARRIAEHDEDFLGLVRVLDGLGNTHRERGSLPKARAHYRDAWKMAQVVRDPDEMANVALGLMTVEREAGDLEAASTHGWTALCLQTDPGARANLLLNLGTLLREGGDLEGAERAYRLSAASATTLQLSVMARDALAFCAALAGNASEYARRRPRARGLAPYVRVQLGYFRGAALRALGDPRAGRVLSTVERYARAHRLSEWEIKAAQLRERQQQAGTPVVQTPAVVSRGLRELESALT